MNKLIMLVVIVVLSGCSTVGKHRDALCKTPATMEGVFMQLNGQSVYLSKEFRCRGFK